MDLIRSWAPDVQGLSIRNQRVQPLSLLELCAVQLWTPRIQTRTRDRSFDRNCEFCFLAASHIARSDGALRDVVKIFKLRPLEEILVHNFGREHGVDFVLKCNKAILKKFIVLHILYAKGQIKTQFSHNFLNKHPWRHQVCYRGTTSLCLSIAHLRTCFDIFILYLCQHLHWISTPQNSQDLSHVKIDCSIQSPLPIHGRSEDISIDLSNTDSFNICHEIQKDCNDICTSCIADCRADPRCGMLCMFLIYFSIFTLCIVTPFFLLMSLVHLMV